MGSSNKLTTIATDDIGVICMLVNPRQAYQREDALVVFANFTEFQKTVTIDTSSYELLRDNAWTDLAQGKHVRLAGDPIILGPYEILLLTRST
jgi:hypothetical protein